MANVDPTAVIDTSGEQVYDGVSAFVLEAGEELTVPAGSNDPGSDDLTFTWDWARVTGTSDEQTSLVNPPATDPAISPSMQPRDIALEASHTYGEACLYELGVTVTDDDGGSATDTAPVLITGNATVSKGHGWWLNQYRVKSSNDFTPAEAAVLPRHRRAISAWSSTSTRMPRPRAAATLVLNNPAKSPAEVIFDQHALGAWLNFANGSVSLSTPSTPTERHARQHLRGGDVRGRDGQDEPGVDLGADQGAEGHRRADRHAERAVRRRLSLDGELRRPGDLVGAAHDGVSDRQAGDPISMTVAVPAS